MRWKIQLMCGVVLVAVSCNKSPLVPTAEEQLATDIAIIDEYLADNRITAVQHVSGLRWVIKAEGTGTKVTSEDCIRIEYSGRLLFETVPFETGTNYPTTMSASTDFPLIKGWRIGLKEVAKGGTMTLYIPSGLGYGSVDKKQNGEIIIPKNSILVFDITIQNITKYNAAGRYCYPWP